MDCKRPESGRRAASFAAALFAITLNFLQPLAHAAMMREVGPIESSLWASMCLPAGQDDQGTTPDAGKLHECCLGLAHAATLAAPSNSFVLAELIVVAIRFVAEIDALAPIGIRDGPHQPRAPPTLA
jgi:hypothetical protein